MHRTLLHTYVTAVFYVLSFSVIFSQGSKEKDYHQIPASYKNHPEYGKLKLEDDVNSIELIHLRAKNSRTFKNQSGSYATVSTAGTFHFKDASNRWISIQDKISQSPNNTYGIFQTELPIKINSQTGKTEMTLTKGGQPIQFGENTSLQFLTKDGVVIESFSSNKFMDNPSITDNQMVLREFLPGLNRVQEIQYWSVRTDYFIEQKLDMPVNTEFLQITDEINMPVNWRIEMGEGKMTPNGWNGDLLILNEKGNLISTISRPLYYDSFKSENKQEVSSHLGVGSYKVIKNDSGHLIQLLVPASWLNQDNLVYPLIIDPTTTNTYATNHGVYDLSGFNAACQVDMDLNFPPTGGYVVTGTNTSYQIWAKGFIASSGSTDYYADRSEQRSRVGSLNGWSAVQNGTGTNHASTNPSYYTPANNGQTYNMNNLTIANGCYSDRPTIPYTWQGYQTFLPLGSGPASLNVSGCVMNYQELVTNTWVVTATYDVAVVATGPTTVSYPSTSVCSNLASLNATQTGTTGGAFTSTPAGLTINSATGEVNPSTSTVGTYTITYSVGTAPCNSSSTAVLTILNSVTPTFTPVAPICAGGTFALPTSSTNAPAITGTWSPAINNTATTVYTFTPDAGQCAVSTTMTVTVNPDPAPNISGTSSICLGETINLSTTATGTYSWTGPNGFTSSLQNPTIPNATAAASGTYTLTTIGICSSMPATINVVVNNLPDVTVSKTDALCDGTGNGTVTAIVSGGSGTYTYVWMPGNLSGATLTNLPVGSYSVTVTDGNGCVATGAHTVGLMGSIPVNVTPISTTINEGESVNLFAATNSTFPGLTYTWSPPTGLSCTDCPNPIASPTETTTYIATITSPNGCTGKDSSQIHVRIICGEHFIPTIFSPNGDGNNDEFRIFGKCIVAMDLKIYNRWGEVVFESTDPQYGWDGTYKGELMNPASFIYAVNISFIDGRFIKEKGSISLVR